MFKSLWGVIKWGFLLAVVLTAVAVVVVAQRLPSEVDRYVRSELERRFPNLICYIGETELVAQRGVVVHDVTLYARDPKTGRRGEKLVSIAATEIACPLSLSELLDVDWAVGPAPTKLTLINPIVHLTRQQDGTFPALKAFRSEIPSQRQLPVEIVGGELIYQDVSLENSSCQIEGVSLTLTPRNNSGENCWDFSASVDHKWWRRLTASGECDLASGSWDISVRGDHIACLPEWTQFVASELESPELESLRGYVDLECQAVQDNTAPLGFRFTVTGQLEGGRVTVPHLDKTLTALEVAFHVTDESINVHDVAGYIDAARLVQLTYTQDGLLTRRGATLEINVERLALDDAIIRRWTAPDNDKANAFLDAMEFSTTATMNAAMVYRDGKWNPSLVTLDVANTSLTSRKTPYRVNHLDGWLRLTEDDLKFSFANDDSEATPLRLEGHLTGITNTNGPTGKIKASGQHIPISERLIELLPPKPRQVVTSLHPQGNLSAMILLEFSPHHPLKKYMEVGLERCSIRYEKFPYPLTNLDGFLVMHDDRWTFNNIIGQHETTTVRGFGHIIPRQREEIGERRENDYEFFLNVSAVDLPIDGDLPKAILNRGQRETLTGVGAKGKVMLDAKISYIPALQSLSIKFTAVPLPGMSICPKHFPYLMTDVTGTINYADGRVKIDQFRARHQEARVSSSVECRFGQQGDWSLSLDEMTVDRLPPNRELQNALPAGLLTVYETMQVQGPINLKGWVGFSRGARNDTPLRTEWDVEVVMHDNTVQVGLLAEHLFGKVLVYGRSEEGNIRVGGSLWLDQAVMLGFPLTDVTGPFYYATAEERIYLGPSDGVAHRLRREQLRPPSSILPVEFGGGSQFDASQQSIDPMVARPMSAKFVEGNLRMKGEVVLGRTPKYRVGLEGSGMDLSRIAHLFGSVSQRLEGRVACRATVHGEGRRMETLGGNGKIWLSDADVYELPTVMRLFQVLRLGEPKRGAFSAAEIDFTLQGNRAILDPVYFDGDTLSLCGSGDYQIDTRHIDLLMGTRIGHRSMEIPVISSVIGKAGDQFAQLRIEGPLGATNVQRISLPEFRQALSNSRDDQPQQQHSPRQPQSTATAPANGSYYVPPEAEVPRTALRDRFTFWR